MKKAWVEAKTNDHRNFRSVDVGCTGKWAYVYGIGRTPFVAETERNCTLCATFQSVVGPLDMF